MPRLRRSKSGMRARVSSTVSTNASTANPRCGISKHVGSPGRNNSRINVSTRAGEMGERGRERRLQDDTEHDQPLPPPESQFLLKHVDELVEIAPQLGAGRSSSQRRKYLAEEVIQMGTKRISTDKSACRK